MNKSFLSLIKLNFDLDYHLDEEFNRVYIYPDGLKNQKECIIVEYDKFVDKYYACGHGEKTNINYVCNPTEEELLYCVLTVIDKFRKDNGWTWKMPCETRLENEGLN